MNFLRQPMCFFDGCCDGVDGRAGDVTEKWSTYSEAGDEARVVLPSPRSAISSGRLGGRLSGSEISGHLQALEYSCFGSDCGLLGQGLSRAWLSGEFWCARVRCCNTGRPSWPEIAATSATRNTCGKCRVVGRPGSTGARAWPVWIPARPRMCRCGYCGLAGKLDVLCSGGVCANSQP